MSLRSTTLCAALVSITVVGTGALTLLTPQLSAACGGTFCDAGPTVMPVDQTGESIVFWLDDGGAEPYMEAHIQIQYEGDAERFAWIIPVMEAPEVLVGSQGLFDNLLQATVPTFTTTTQFIDDCGDGFSGFCLAASFDSAGGDEFFTGTLGSSGDEGAESDGGEGPEILDRGVAGAFEYVTLTGDNIDEIVTWLEDSGYAQDDDAPPILAEYLEEGFVFVAVKLRGGVDVDEIHPLAIRYPGTEPCIPVRLTRIAAAEDMAIRAFFLGEEQVASSNWPRVVLNHSRFDWVNGPATNYNEVVSLAIDEAGGRAFVTEYAGTDAVVSTSGILDPSWDASIFEGIEPTQVVTQLVQQGLMFCSGPQCSYAHLQIEPLLSTYLPAPDGVSVGDFYACVECFPDLIDQEAWAMAPGFAADFAERVTGPAEHAVDMLSDATQLTRLFTLLSPHEMIEDPLFHPASGLSPVDNNITATRFNHCSSAPSYFELSDGSQVAVDEGGLMPLIGSNPAAARIERVPMSGPPQVETDNSEVITKALEDYNRGRYTGPSPDCAVQKVGAEGLLSFLSIFGIAYFARRRREHA